jgi:hypothetical protein
MSCPRFWRAFVGSNIAQSHDKNLSEFSCGVVEQPSSRNRYANVTTFLRGRHLFVTPQCQVERKQQNQQMKGQTKNHEISEINH